MILIRICVKKLGIRLEQTLFVLEQIGAAPRSSTHTEGGGRYSRVRLKVAQINFAPSLLHKTNNSVNSRQEV